jgi:hypothetical protein
MSCAVSAGSQVGAVGVGGNGEGGRTSAGRRVRALVYLGHSEVGKGRIDGKPGTRHGFVQLPSVGKQQGLAAYRANPRGPDSDARVTVWCMCVRVAMALGTPLWWAKEGGWKDAGQGATVPTHRRR